MIYLKSFDSHATIPFQTDYIDKLGSLHKERGGFKSVSRIEERRRGVQTADSRLMHDLFTHVSLQE